MQQKPPPFNQHGTEEEPIEVSADEILDAIAQGRNVDVEYAIIDGDLDIKRIAARLELNEDAQLSVKGKIKIWHSSIYARTGFASACFDKFVSISGNLFSDDISFFRARFRRDTHFDQNDFSSSDVDFRRARFDETIAFRKTIFGKVATFWGSSFYGAVAFRMSVLDRLLPDSLVSIGDACSKSSKDDAGYFYKLAGKAYLNQKECLHASDSFRNAKVEYEKEGKYDDAGRMYVREKESSRLALKFQKGQRLKRAWFWIWKHASNYGESPWCFIRWIAVIVLIFALIYLPIMPAWWPSIEFKEYPFHEWSDGFIDGFLFNIVAAVYYSAVTFATLGFGDITPVNIVGRLCAIAEVLLGYLMFGVLITLVARKMTRS